MVMLVIIAYTQCYQINFFFFTVTSFLRGHFNMSALDRLEKVARIPIFNKLAPKYLDMASALCFHETVLDDLRNTNNPVEGSKAVMRTWLLGKSSLPSTWQVLLEKLQAIGMGKLAQGIEQYFTIKPVFSPLSLVSDVISMYVRLI